jgi:hypothetical protein
MRFRDGSGKKWTETLTMVRLAFGEENMSYTRRAETHRDRKKTGEVRSKVKSMLIIFFDMDVDWDCSQRICPGRPGNQFHMLL